MLKDLGCPEEFQMEAPEKKPQKTDLHGSAEGSPRKSQSHLLEIISSYGEALLGSPDASGRGSRDPQEVEEENQEKRRRRLSISKRKIPKAHWHAHKEVSSASFENLEDFHSLSLSVPRSLFLSLLLLPSLAGDGADVTRI